MALDTQGILAAVTIAMYVSFLLVSIKLVAKYGISRGDGWILLLIFCIIQVLGGSLLVAAEKIMPINISLYIDSYALESSGLSPLLVCMLGPLHSIFQTPDGFSSHDRLFHLLQILGTVTLILTIIGISNSSSNSSSSSVNTMCRVSVILFAVLYIILTCFVMRYRKQLLKAISIALPFLAIWTLYSVLSTFSSSSFDVTTTIQPNTGDLAKFNIFTGEWQIYLIMDMLMEYAIVIIYSVAGLVLPLNEDYKSSESYQAEYPLSKPQY